MVIKSDSVWDFFDISVDRHVILPGPQNLVPLGLHLSLMSLVSAWYGELLEVRPLYLLFRDRMLILMMK